MKLLLFLGALLLWSTGILAQQVQLLRQKQEPAVVVTSGRYYLIHFPVNQIVDVVNRLPQEKQQYYASLLQNMQDGKPFFMDLNLPGSKEPVPQLRQLIVEDVGAYLLLQGQAYIEPAVRDGKNIKTNGQPLSTIQAQQSNELNQPDGSSFIPVSFTKEGSKAIIFSGSYDSIFRTGAGGE